MGWTMSFDFDGFLLSLPFAFDAFLGCGFAAFAAFLGAIDFDKSTLGYTWSDRCMQSLLLLSLRMHTRGEARMQRPKAEGSNQFNQCGPWAPKASWRRSNQCNQFNRCDSCGFRSVALVSFGLFSGSAGVDHTAFSCHPGVTMCHVCSHGPVRSHGP